jgi:hypothetical protein
MSKTCKYNQTEPLIVKKGTFKGIKMQILTVAAAANTALTNAVIDLTQIAVKATLTRGKDSIVLLQDNLDALIRFNQYKQMQHVTINGLTTLLHAAGVYEENTRFIDVPFNCLVDSAFESGELKVEVTVAKAASVFTAAVNTADSIITFDLETGVGYETHLSTLHSKPIVEGTKKDTYVLGDSIQKIMFINKDKTDYTAPVIDTLGLNSDRTQWSKNFNELLHYHLTQVDTNMLENWGVVRGNFIHPQTFAIFDGLFSGQFANGGNYMHNVSLDIKFHEAEVATNENEIMYLQFSQTAAQKARAAEKRAKHNAENNAVIMSNN